jgi:nicotinamidase-related amidase
MNARSIDPSHVAVLLIDTQPAFLDMMRGSKESLLTHLECLLTLAECLELPLIATFEQPTGKKGWLPERLERVFPVQGQRFTKNTFNCCSEEPIAQTIKRLPIYQIVLAGAETDVCILQSALGLLDMGLAVFLLEDCVFTSEPHPRPALERMYRAGVVPSTLKIFFYELQRTVDKDAQSTKWRDGLAAFSARFDIENLPLWDPAT